MWAITCKAVYENGVFRPVEPVGDIPEHTCVEVVVSVANAEAEQSPSGPPGQPMRHRVLGLNRGKLVYIAEDFDAPLGDAFWLGES